MPIYFYYLDKNSEWVTDGMSIIMRTSRLVDPPVDVRVELKALVER
jgi:hypothetical protein